jgi:hypothetical protein
MEVLIMAPTKMVVDVITGEAVVVELSQEEIAALPPPAPAPMPTITRRQLRLALLNRFGLTSAQVEAEIAALPRAPIEREAAMIEWQDATTYERDHWLVIALGAALGLTTAQIDDAWREAATL